MVYFYYLLLKDIWGVLLLGVIINYIFIFSYVLLLRDIINYIFIFVYVFWIMCVGIYFVYRRWSRIIGL